MTLSNELRQLKKIFEWADISVQPTDSAELAVFPASHIDRCPGRLCLVARRSVARQPCLPGKQELESGADANDTKNQSETSY